MRPIEEFSDDDLVDELMRRYDDIVIGARRILNTGATRTERRRWWKGDMDACVGLVDAVKLDLVKTTWDGKDD